MRISSQLLLTFLLNACWQVALIAALAGIGAMLLRNSVARYRHWLWVSALCLAFLVPAITSSRVLFAQPVSNTEARAVMHAALVRLAKLNMDQAIQIATSQQPGKVLVCSLGAKGWEEPGKLGKDGKVFYHVIIADETNAGESTHVWVNAIDGTVMKTEKELPRKKRSAEDQ